MDESRVSLSRPLIASIKMAHLSHHILLIRLHPIKAPPELLLSGTSTSIGSPASALHMSSPTGGAAKASPGGSRIGRPPQWTVSRSRKLARLYVYTTLSIEKIIKVLEDDVFKPRKNSAQKTIHKMLDNDPRYLRPESRVEMNQRINSLSVSPARLRKKRKTPASLQLHPSGGALKHVYAEKDAVLSSTEFSTSGSSQRAEDASSFDFSAPGNTPSSATQPSPVAGRSQLSVLTRNPKQKGPATSDSDSDSNTSSSCVRDIQRRVSDCPTHYAQQIASLLRDFTISSASDLDESQPFDRRPSAALTERSEPAQVSGSEAFEAFPEPGFALPGDLLTAHRRSCADFPGQEHGSGKCWCSIARATSSDASSWLLPTGELSERARRVLNDPSRANLGLRDCFGNSPLHLFAALEGYQEALFGMVPLSTTDVRAFNNANQTFLHVLNVEWFSDLGSPSAPLKQLLAFLRKSYPDLVYETDVYGRNFFHRAHSLIRDPEILAALLPPSDPTSASRRDAFGFNPLANTQLGGEGPFIPPRRVGSPTPHEEEMGSTSRSGPGVGSPRSSSADEDSFLAYHARLVQVIQSSYNNPRVEDAEGRNGLHCLAEAIINQQTMDEQRSAMSASGRPTKRSKHEKATTTTLSSSTATAFSTLSAFSSGDSSSESTLVARLRHLEGLLVSANPVDVQHYDKAGNTVLMAFILHIPDEQDDRAKTLQAILETLLRRGSGGGGGGRETSRGIIEARNSRGETALLVAARLGRKVALTTLLEHGANVHARDVHGRGILELLDETCRSATARDDVALYARLEACRVLLTGRRDWGVVLKPSIVMEWQARTVV
ncbi:hypothetical protein QBC46DRAFT_454343 [Diplogelasinospora grovesii]|uniref:Ankyrin n=1 Tax=Diplogelasinospora grovesii TaxID=303347 RepID=A0AAN6MW91_9PEZI|nr:hypothetical protein QBC46DRAFT_454343 [Diplogelasinospora grovesii]